MAQYDTQDPPTDAVEEPQKEAAEIDLGEIHFDDIPLCISNEDELLRKFTEEKVPIASTPRHEPPMHSEATGLFRGLLKLAALELILCGMPVAIKMFGGDRYTDSAFTFWGHPTATNTGSIFSVALVLCALINAACLMIQPVWYPETTWIKYSVYAFAIALVVTHKAGDTRLDIALPLGLMLGLVYTSPMVTKKTTALAYPVFCFAAFVVYAVAHKGTHWYRGEENIYLTISQIAFGIGLPLMACSVALALALVDINLTYAQYLIVEVLVASSTVLSILVPTNV